MGAIANTYGKTRNGSYNEFYIHKHAENIGPVSFPNEKYIYSNELKKYKSNLQSTFRFESSKYSDIFELLDEIGSNIQSTMITTQVNDSVSTSGEKITIMNADGSKIEQSLSRLGSFSGVEDLLTNVDGKLSNLSTFISTLDKILIDTNIAFNNELINDLAKEIILERKNSQVHSKIIQNIITEKINKYQGRFIKRSNNQNLSQIEKYAIRAKTFVTVLKNIAAQEGIDISTDSKYLIQRSAYFATQEINQIGGFLYEQMIRDMINSRNNIMLKEVQAAIAGSGFSEISAQIIPENQYKLLNRKKVRNTSDVNLLYSANDEGGEASLSVSLPGISVKKVTEGEKGITDVKIQSDTNFQDVLIRSKIYNTHYHYSLINIIANYGTGQGIKRETLNQVYRYISAKNILNSLVGTMAENDFSYFMIINDKVFTVEEIIKGLYSSNNSDFNIKMTMSPSSDAIRKEAESLFYSGTSGTAERQEAAEDRSHTIYSVMHNANVSFSLLINNRRLF